MKLETLQSIRERRSIRAYRPEQISREELDTVLEAGTWAPTGMGRQSPKMVAVQDPETIALLSRLNARVLGSDTDPFYGAPTAVVVFADPEVPTWLEDGSLVMGTLLLAAHTAGLGSCWIHRARQVFEAAEGKALIKRWGIPDRFVGVGHCILGYAAGEAPQPKPRKAGYIVRD